MSAKRLQYLTALVAVPGAAAGCGATPPHAPLAYAKQLADRFEHRHRTGLAQLVNAESPGTDRDRVHAHLTGGADVPRGIANHHRVTALPVDPGKRGLDEVRLGLCGFDVRRGGPPVGEPARIEQIEIVLHLLLLGRAGEHDG